MFVDTPLRSSTMIFVSQKLKSSKLTGLGNQNVVEKESTTVSTTDLDGDEKGMPA
jgi:hypothetical protein